MDDYDTIRRFVLKSKQKSCDYTPANLILWGEVYKTEYCIVDDMLILKYIGDNKVQFSFPIGDGDKQDAIDWIISYCETHRIPFIMNKVEPEMYEWLEENSPERFQYELDRDSFDYVYKTEDLQKLSGKKYHGKKNHINKFKKENPEWSYEAITEDNKEECVQMVKQWCVENGCCDDKEKAIEVCLVIKAIRNIQRLHMKGGLIRTKQGIVALTLGEEIDETTYVIHFEKAFASVQGAYPMINQQFIEHELMEYTYVNREDDLGLEGLRKAKESYHPVFLVEKGRIMEKVRAAKECVAVGQ